jgi:hypothetical protein
MGEKSNFPLTLLFPLSTNIKGEVGHFSLVGNQSPICPWTLFKRGILKKDN